MTRQGRRFRLGLARPGAGGKIESVTVGDNEEAEGNVRAGLDARGRAMQPANQKSPGPQALKGSTVRAAVRRYGSVAAVPTIL